MPDYPHYIPQHVAQRVDLNSPLIHRFNRADVIASFDQATYANASGDRTIDYDPTRSASTALIGPFASGEKAITTINGRRFIQIEEARTDISLNSGTPIANWGATRASWNLTPDYLGGVMGNLIEDNTLAQNHRCEEGTVSFDGSSEYCMSFYAKAKERFRYQIYGTTGAFPTAVTADYNLTTGAVTGTGAGTNDAGIYLVKDGIYRCWMTATSDAAATSRWECRMMDASGNVVYDGDNSSGMWFWGAQYEIGGYPSSYIPTVGASATRAKDELKWDSIGSALVKQGTFTMQVIPRVSSVTTRGNLYLFVLEDTVSGNRVNARLLADDRIRVQKYTGSFVNMVTTDALTWDVNDILTLGFDGAAGSVTVSGASGGDGVYTDTAWDDVVTGDTDLHWGMTHTQSGHFNGLISEPY
jgi:hypothetical protein